MIEWAGRSAMKPGWVGVMLVAAALASGTAHAETFKWTDEKGTVHYGERVPPEYVNRSSSVLNKQGVTVRKTDAALTPEQIRSREEQLAKEREAQRLEAEQRRKDLALLNSYASEQEIDVLKGRAIKQIEQSLVSIRAELGELEKRRARLQSDRTGYLKSPVPEKLVRDIEFADKEIARQKEAIDERNKEIGQIAAKYDSDKMRYREVKAKEAERNARITSQTGQPLRKAN